ncbi:pleckstrin domain-containing protein [Pycnococcus provasolii]
MASYPDYYTPLPASAPAVPHNNASASASSSPYSDGSSYAQQHAYAQTQVPGPQQAQQQQQYAYAAPPPQAQQHHAAAPQPPPQQQQRLPSGMYTDDEGHTRFRVNLSERNGDVVVVKITLDGLKIYDASGARQLRQYALNMITRWTQYGDKLTILTRCSPNADEHPIAFVADTITIRELIDTLTSTCLQLVEIRDAEEEDERIAADARLAAYTAEKEDDEELEKKEAEAEAAKAEAATRAIRREAGVDASSVDFWARAEKAGWLWSKGAHIKTWRKRWHILKAGYIFRFLDDNIDPHCKPRGVSDLKDLDYVAECGTTTTNPGMRGLLSTSSSGGQTLYLFEVVFVEWSKTGGDNSAKKLTLGADSAEERESWIRAVNQSGLKISSPPKDPEKRDMVPQRQLGTALHENGVPLPPMRPIDDVLPKKASTHDQLLSTLKKSYDNTAEKEQERRASFGSVTYATGPNVASYGSGGGGGAPPPQHQQHAAADAGQWEMAYAPDGRAYWFNRATNETRWNLI